jgi:hypothetical protein
MTLPELLARIEAIPPTTYARGYIDGVMMVRGAVAAVIQAGGGTDRGVRLPLPDFAPPMLDAALLRAALDEIVTARLQGRWPEKPAEVADG